MISKTSVVLKGKGTRRTPTGFTLIEIVVATFIMAIFTVLVLGVSSGVLQIWSNAAGRVESTRESRQVLSTIESDFDGIVYTSEGEVLHYETETIDVGATSTGFDLLNQARLILVTSTLDAPETVAYDSSLNTSGDICAIRYELNHLKIFSGSDAVFSLYRGVVDPRTTFLGDGGGSFEGFLANTDIETTWETYIEGAEQTAASAPITVADAIGAYSSQNRRNIYASNAVDFKITFYARSSDGTLPSGVVASGPVNTGETYALKSDLEHDYTSFDVSVIDGVTQLDSTPIDDELVYADLEFAFLSSEGATVFQNHISGLENSIQNDPDGLTALEQIIERYGQRFTRRVGLNGSR